MENEKSEEEFIKEQQERYESDEFFRMVSHASFNQSTVTNDVLGLILSLHERVQSLEKYIEENKK